MSVSVSLIPGNVPTDIWYRFATFGTILTFRDLIALFFQTCRPFRPIGSEVMRRIALPEQRQMGLPTTDETLLLNLPLERIVRLWLSQPFPLLRAIRSSVEASPPVIYGPQFEDARVLLDERLIAFREGLLSLDPEQSSLSSRGIIDLAERAKSITKACLIVRSLLNPNRIAEGLVTILFQYSTSTETYFGPLPTETGLRDMLAIIFNHIEDEEVWDAFFSQLARAPFLPVSMVKEAIHQISNMELKKKLLRQMADESRKIQTTCANYPRHPLIGNRKDPLNRSRQLCESCYRKALKHKQIMKKKRVLTKKIAQEEPAQADPHSQVKRVEQSINAVLKRKLSEDADHADANPSKVAKTNHPQSGFADS
jgi:hypothetical protein